MCLVRYTCLLALAAAVSVHGQDTSKKSPATPKSGPPVEIRMADGSSVRMNLTQPIIDIATKYGKLSIPTNEIRKIEFGFRYPDGAEEKITALREQGNTVGFLVHPQANKIQIKQAVEALLKVKVARVNLMNVRGKIKRLGRFSGKRPDWKKAFVTLKEGEKLELYESA